MGVIMHNNIPYGGGSSIEPNPQESATDQLETLGIDGDVYEVTDANAAREVQATITEAQSRVNLADGDSVPTIFGKIKKFFSDLKTVAFTGAYSDLSGTPTIPTVNDGTLTIKQNNNNLGTFTANQSTASNINIECALPSDVEGSKVATGNPLTITDAAGIKAEKIVIEFEPKQAGSGTPSPSNIRPITGYTSLSADGCGKNLWGYGNVIVNDYNKEVEITRKLTGSFSMSLTVTSNDTDASTCAMILYYKSGSTSATYQWARGSRQAKTFNIGDNVVDKIRFYSSDNYNHSSGDTATWSDIMLEEGSSPSTYEPFKGDNVTVQFGQTLYGGKLTILQDGSADVYCDTAYNEYDGSSDEDWHFENAAAGKNFWIPEPIFKKPCYGNDLICNMALSTSSAGTEKDKVFVSNGGNLNVTFGDTLNISTAADFKTWLASHVLQVAGTIANPFTIHLSPVETLTLLQGINNVWTDGTTLSLTYQPDNAIGEAKGTAQDAMAMVNALASTAVKVIAKKGQYEMGVRDWVDMPDCSLSLDKGTYLIMGWCNLTGDNYHSGSTYYRYGCAIADSSNNRLVGNTFKPDSNQAYEASISTCLLETITTDATVRKLKGYMGYSSNSYPIRGGIVAFKIA